MAKAIMVQGTMSNAGKSLLAAGLCRIFLQDGYRVAPFKSQNMALNSFITKEGLEMGRAQVVQAEAAGIQPSVRMNPILLKPTGDSQSQVIVNGEVRGNYSAKDYFAMKKDLVPDIMKAYDSLASENDILVIEGAGSPAEINLRENDIVNMGMAKMAHAPVLLVGDIDRGGVFAQLYGTVMLLEEEEKKYLKGLVINKFRGDVSILKPGLKQIEDRTMRPVLGVVPYLHVDIDDEDSLSERLNMGNRADAPAADNGFSMTGAPAAVDGLSGTGAPAAVDGLSGTGAPAAGDGLSMTGAPAAGDGFSGIVGSKIPGVVDIAVIRLPRLSNFTDFSAFERIPGVSLRYVDSVSEFGHPDLVILPGTKNTIGDLLWLRENGLEACIKKASDSSEGGTGDTYARRAAVIGICGGYQMLGETLSDPLGVESGEAGGRTVRGMGLLPVDTVFTKEKTRTQVSGVIRHPPAEFGSLTGQKIEGYEIHMGESTIRESSEGVPLTTLDAETGALETIKADGCAYRNVCGTYVHGIFDSEGTAYRIAQSLAAKKGIRLSQAADIDPKTYKNHQYDLLADAIRGSLDMEAVYRILKEGI